MYNYFLKYIEDNLFSLKIGLFSKVLFTSVILFWLFFIKIWGCVINIIIIFFLKWSIFFKLFFMVFYVFFSLGAVQLNFFKFQIYHSLKKTIMIIKLHHKYTIDSTQIHSHVDCILI